MGKNEIFTHPALKYKKKGGVAIFIVASLVKNQPNKKPRVTEFFVK